MLAPLVCASNSALEKFPQKSSQKVDADKTSRFIKYPTSGVMHLRGQSCMQKVLT